MIERIGTQREDGKCQQQEQNGANKQAHEEEEQGGETRQTAVKGE